MQWVSQYDIVDILGYSPPGGGGSDDQVPGGDALQGDGAPWDC